MRRTAMLLTLAVFVLASLSHAGTLANVTLPDTDQVGNTTLVLNGMGLRTKYAFKVYVAGLYIPQKSADPSAILKPDVPRRIVMHFVRDVSKNQLTDGFTDPSKTTRPTQRRR